MFSKVKDVRVETRVSKKTNNEYTVLIVEFVGGYKVENFLNQDQQFILHTILNSK